MAKRVQVTFDCADPAALAGFWAAALEYIEPPPPDGHATWQEWLQSMGIPEDRWNEANAVEDPDGAGPRLFFQKVPEGKAAKNRVHLDVSVAPRGTPPDERQKLASAEATRLQTLGATLVNHGSNDQGEHWIVMQDPEGNEFCLQ